ncbi:4Fe-4S dicluster domain-containing protein [Salipaludibacillus aurantiacus]|uniref:2-oxoglutarate ferredoxin oxidoreductase subunit delta n=1 Tax=Salipaludibacillus aurantiacus TaxID=1601833 RepID=A0A1H9PB28_9BACI|nr:4Fe-4S dicluster domain-containing protein [Salipaludibacillus aurantiacus]SER45386.1 2-oxoglutarate ferredoxin oxidoreductase subunit delta [Salipaludibacillus aurantiacus]
MKVTFREERCKGCSLCVTVCPQEIIKLSEKVNKRGYQPAEVVDQEACTSCSACAIICPDAVITIKRPERKKRKAS